MAIKKTTDVTSEMVATPTSEDIELLLAGIAQGVINIAYGRTTIEQGSQIYRAMNGLCKPEVANLLRAAPSLLEALRRLMDMKRRAHPVEHDLDLDNARTAISKATGG